MNNQILAINTLGVKNQLLISRCLDLGKMYEAKQLQYIDRELLLIRYKMLGNSKRYIWRTQDDKKARPSHAANDDKIFAWNNKPTTGHPEEDYGCRCWAEPLGAKEYARQFLISAVNDNPDKWTNTDFVKHYRTGKGMEVSLQKAGLLGDVIEHYSETLGIYNKVNRQIIDKAKTIVEGGFTYSFGRSYAFGNNWNHYL